MTDSHIYHDIAARTGGAFLLGVVGPVRTGKSTFIKRFMETLVIPRIDDAYRRERARDELPQSGSGRTIMTSEPKFVPEEAVNIALDGETALSVRLIDCVGYMVDGAAGQFEDGEERLVTTPWFDHEISMTDAAEQGTYKVIVEHSTIGIVVTTDGSICDIPREKYLQPERRVIEELKEIGKPFVILLNCTDPDSSQARALAEELTGEYGVPCLRVNCLTMGEEEIAGVIRSVLKEFPLKALGVFLPDWMDALNDQTPLKEEMLEWIRSCCAGMEKIKDCDRAVAALAQHDKISAARLERLDLGQGTASVSLQLPRSLYYEILSEKTGISIQSDGELIETLSELSVIKEDYDRLSAALEDVRTTGYGIVMPDASQMRLEEPQIVRQGGKYTVKLKADAPAIHMFMTNVETEVTPAIGGENASEDIINFLLQGFDGDVNRIWQSNIFGKSLDDIAEEGLASKLQAMPENARRKLRMTLQRIVNEGCSSLICILL